MSGQSQNDPRITSSLDPAYIKAAVRASWMGTHNGAEGDYTYWIEKASGAEQFSDGIWRIGWNRYWETRMFQDSGDPHDGDKPALFQPTSNPPGPTDLETRLAAIEAQLPAIEARLTKLEAGGGGGGGNGGGDSETLAVLREQLATSKAILELLKKTAGKFGVQ